MGSFQSFISKQISYSYSFPNLRSMLITAIIHHGHCAFLLVLNSWDFFCLKKACLITIQLAEKTHKVINVSTLKMKYRSTSNIQGYQLFLYRNANRIQNITFFSRYLGNLGEKNLNLNHILKCRLKHEQLYFSSFKNKRLCSALPEVKNK